MKTLREFMIESARTGATNQEIDDMVKAALKWSIQNDAKGLKYVIEVPVQCLLHAVAQMGLTSKNKVRLLVGGEKVRRVYMADGYDYDYDCCEEDASQCDHPHKADSKYDPAGAGINPTKTGYYGATAIEATMKAQRKHNTERSKEVDHDPINSPSHYTQGIECADYIESHGMDFFQGNAVKYLTRFRHKGSPVEDLKKAEWYLKRLIEVEEKKEVKS